MVYFILFLLGALALTAWITPHLGSAWWGVAVFVLGFALMHILYLVFFWLFSLGAKKGVPIEKQSPMSRRACAGVGEFLCLYAGIRPQITGLEKLPRDRRFLLVCNHRSMFDPLFVIHYLRDYNISFVSKPSNIAIPLVGQIACAAGFLPIDRENDRKALKTILTAADYMKRDLCSMGIYPEGTRSRTGALLPFHAGSFKTAQRAGVPLAICCIQGTEQLRRRPLGRKTVRFDVLEVLPADQVKAMTTAELSEYSRRMMELKMEN